MQVTLSRKPTFKTRVVLLTKDETPKNIVDFSGDVNEIAVRYENNLTIIYCGLGDNRTCTPNIVRTMAAKGAQKAIELKRTTFSLVSSNPCQDRNNDNHAAIEGALLGTYKFSKYKSQTGYLSERNCE